tara:strand:+ start:510 stop:737 length:228 start_codon:yes stop_codon:yes gene_type:complete
LGNLNNDALGVMYDKGKGVTQDYQEAMKWYRKAAEQGFFTRRVSRQGTSDGSGLGHYWTGACGCVPINAAIHLDC